MRTLRSYASNIFTLLKETFNEWKNDGGTRLGASLAYYTAFSLAPLLLLTIAIAGLVFGMSETRDRIFNELRATMGDQTARDIQSMLQAAKKPASGTLATIIGFGTLLLGASAVMDDLQFTLNKIWNAPQVSGFMNVVKDKLLSFGMVLGIGFLLLVSLVISTLLATMGRYFGYLLPLPEWLLQAINMLVSLTVITFLFAAIFKLLPNTHVRWSDVWEGAVFTSVLFTIGKSVLGIYLGKGTVGSSYGTAGSVLVLLLWLYYSAQILYFGAEFTKVTAQRQKKPHVPLSNRGASARGQ